MWAVTLVAVVVDSFVQELVALCPMCFEETLGDQVLLYTNNKQAKTWVIILTLHKDAVTAYYNYFLTISICRRLTLANI